MIVRMFIGKLMGMFVRMLAVAMGVGWSVCMDVREVNIKFHTGDSGPLLPGGVQMIAVEAELLEFVFKP